jgi:accessory gene regulator protein AgrB
VCDCVLPPGDNPIAVHKKKKKKKKKMMIIIIIIIIIIITQKGAVLIKILH